MSVTVTDLGVQATGDLWCHWRCARHPRTGAPLALGSLANGGFMVIDPATERGRQVIPETRFTTGWAIGQAPNGSIYQSGFSSNNQSNVLQRWDWTGTTSTVVTLLPAKAIFCLDVANDGTVYIPDYHGNRIFAVVPETVEIIDCGSFDAFGKHVRNIFCGNDGWVYATVVDGAVNRIVTLNPTNGRKATLSPLDADDAHWQTGHLIKDFSGRILVPRPRRDNQRQWNELINGESRPVAPDDRVVRLFNQGAKVPLVFSDEGHIDRIDDDGQQAVVTATRANGARHTFTVPRKNVPLRIFSLFSSGDTIWGGTFIPITLFSHDPVCSKTIVHGNPTESNGEIYAMITSGEKLFMAAYTQAALSRFDPEKPWNPGREPDHNPRYLGRIKEDGLPLQRPYGKARDHAGRVFFTAKGDYGCMDSGVCRIEPHGDIVTRWIYPQTTFEALVYLPDRCLLMVSERRIGDPRLYATLLCPETGEVRARIPLFNSPGGIHSWLFDATTSRVYGLYGYQAMLFSLDIDQVCITAHLPNIGTGTHCHECLIDGPDGDIWCLTVDGVYAVQRDLRAWRTVAEYPDHAGKNHYRFGMITDANGAVYFPNGTHLMRLPPPAPHEGTSRPPRIPGPPAAR